MKKRILFINTVSGFSSTGRITASLSKIEEFDSLVCYGRKKDYEEIGTYKFSNFFDNSTGAARTILFDNNLNICSNATKKLIKKIKEFQPDIVHLHNLHGYYVNVEMLFEFLKDYNKPVVWTLHDTWALTGYCPIADYYDCEKYKTQCENCPCGFYYPYSIFKQNLVKDFYEKEKLFNSIENLTLVTPSKWLKEMCSMSKILREIPIVVINNGIELSTFKPSKPKKEKFTALAVAGYWTIDKGIDDMNKLIPLLDKDIDVVVVGGNSEKIKGCKTIKRTSNKQELIDLYSSSHVLLMPTLQDNFPTVNIEALACGTPVITYNTGGSPEIIDEKTGIVVDKKDYKNMARIVNELKEDYIYSVKDCVNRAKNFSSEHMIEKYKNLYLRILN